MRAALLLTLTACQATPSSTESAPTAPIAVEWNEGDGTQVIVTRTAAGCEIAAPSLTATLDGTTTRAGQWQVVPDPHGRELRGPTGLLARLVDEPSRFSILDPNGVPFARIVMNDDHSAVLRDASRAATGHLESTATETHILDLQRRPIATIRGSSDLRLAAVLAGAPTLPVEARAVYACERLAAVPVRAK